MEYNSYSELYKLLKLYEIEHWNIRDTIPEYDVLKEMVKKDFEATTPDLPLKTVMNNRYNAGRKSPFSEEQIDKIRQLRADGKTMKEIAAILHISVSTVHKYVGSHRDSFTFYFQ